jgi:prevent-host-death family protein
LRLHLEGTVDTVGVRELKARLSHHLKRVQAGHSVTVTDRGRAIARIQPVDASADTGWIMRMVAEGKASWSGGKPKGARRTAVNTGKLLASDIVIRDRR